MKEIQQWKQLLIEYEKETDIQSSKNEEKIDLKKIQEQINTLIHQNISPRLEYQWFNLLKRKGIAY